MTSRLHDCTTLSRIRHFPPVIGYFLIFLIFVGFDFAKHAEV